MRWGYPALGGRGYPLEVWGVPPHGILGVGGPLSLQKVPPDCTPTWCHKKRCVPPWPWTPHRYAPLQRMLCYSNRCSQKKRWPVNFLSVSFLGGSTGGGSTAFFMTPCGCAIRRHFSERKGSRPQKIPCWGYPPQYEDCPSYCLQKNISQNRPSY